MTQENPVFRLYEETIPIGPPVAESFRHAAENVFVPGADESGNATHRIN